MHFSRLKSIQFKSHLHVSLGRGAIYFERKAPNQQSLLSTIMKVSLIALFLVFIGGGGSSPSLVVVDASPAAAAAHDVSSQASEAAAAASLRGSRRVMITASDLRGLEKEEKCGKGEDCDEVAELPAGEQQEDEADEVEKCKGKECDKKDEVEEQSASEDQDQETFVDEEVEDDETDASTGTTTEKTAADPEPAVVLEEISQPQDTTDTNPAMIDEEAGAQTFLQQEPQQPEHEGEDNEATVSENAPSTEDVNIEASPEDTTKATVFEADDFPGPTYTGASGTATSLTTGESGTSVAPQSESGGLQPVGKALLSVALSGAFAAILAVFLVRRQRRNSLSGALVPYSPTKDDSYFVDRDESIEATASSSGSPDKTSRQLVMVDTGEIMVDTGEAVAIDQIESGSQEGYECNDLAIVPPTAVKPYGPEEPPVDEEPPPLKLSLVGGSSILSSLPRQVESPKSKPSAIVPHTPIDKTIVSAPQLSPDGDFEVYEDVAYAEDEANTIRAIVRKYQVENVSIYILYL